MNLCCSQDMYCYSLHLDVPRSDMKLSVMSSLIYHILSDVLVTSPLPCVILIFLGTICLETNTTSVTLNLLLEVKEVKIKSRLKNDSRDLACARK